MKNYIINEQLLQATLNIVAKAPAGQAAEVFLALQHLPVADSRPTLVESADEAATS